ncbi:MAG: MATE family efflux transporter [Lachnospiraceae bacterium]|jgi:putative MATE family efflux protein
MNLDMTKGSPSKLILRFIIPVILGNVFQQLYNMVDTIVVGRFVGQDALAAVGSTGTISFLLLGFMMGLTTGFTVLTGQRYGAGDYAAVRKSAGNAFVLSAIITVVMTVGSMAAMDPILQVMQTPENIYGMAKTYILIICGGMACMVVYNLASSILRAVGNSKVPLYFLILSAVLNVFLDLLMVLVFHWGVAGAAYATVLSQGVSGVLCVVYMEAKIDFLRLHREDFRLDGRVVKNQLHIGVPMALQFSITAIGTMVLQAALNTFGSTVVAAYTAATKIEQLISTCFQAMGVTMASYTAQNWGVHAIDRIRQGQKSAFLMSLIYAIAAYAVILLTLPAFARLFFSGDITEVYGYIQTYIRIAGLFFLPLGMIFIYRNVLQACNFTLIPTLGGAVELAARTICALLAIRLNSYTVACFATASAWCSAGIFLWIAYLFIMHRILQKPEKCYQMAV